MSEEILPYWAQKKQKEVLPDWANATTQEESAAEPVEFQGGLQERLKKIYRSTWDAASDWDKFASDKPLVPTTDTARRYGQRIAMETAPVVATAGEAYRKFRPAGPLAATTAAALTGGAAAFSGFLADRDLLGNVLPGDYDPINQLITGVGGAAGVKIPRLPTEVATQAAEKGVRITPGAASNSRLLKWTEAKIRELPYVGGNMQKAVDQSYSDFSRAVDDLAGPTTVAPGSAAGEFAKQATETLVKKYQGRSNELYDLLNQAIDPSVGVDARALREFLESKERTGAAAKFMDDLVKDGLALFRESGEGVQAGQMTWQNLDDLRRRAGNLIDVRSADVDVGMAKKIAGMVKAEQDRIVAQLGPAEQKAWKNANRYSKAFTTWKEEASKFVTKGRTETIWNSLTTSPNKTNITKIIRAAGGRGSENWKQMRSAVLKDMGTKDGSFDLTTWLRNYNKIKKDRGASDLFFGELQKDVDSLATIAKGVLSPNQFTNTSQSATTALFYTLLGGAGLKGMQGDLGAAGAILSPLAAAKLGDVLLSKPWAIKLLAKGAQVPAWSPKRLDVWAKQFLATAIAEGYKDEGETIANLVMAGSDVPTIPTK